MTIAYNMRIMKYNRLDEMTVRSVRCLLCGLLRKLYFCAIVGGRSGCKTWSGLFKIFWNNSLSACVSHAAPRIDGNCEFVSSTRRSLTFRWTSAKSASSYRYVGHSKNDTTATNEITVDALTPGSYYTFTVTAISSLGLKSNSITCTNSTGESQFCYLEHFYYVLPLYFIFIFVARHKIR